jgi:prepilin-type N-terminal cleavage/methylation domain-containing protein|nr:PilW family protein [Kofleriaceae bacterium]
MVNRASRVRVTSQAGFTLVELMVALVLFGLLTAGVLSVAVSVGQGFREQRQVAETDTAVRAPMDYIVDSMRQANPGVQTGSIYASAGDALCSTQSITVTNNVGAPANDVLDVVYASGGVVTTLLTNYGAGTSTFNVVDATGISAGDTLVISNQISGVIVFVTSVNAGTGAIGVSSQSGCATTLLTANPFPAGSVVIRSLKARFSIAPDVQLNNIPVLFVTPYTANGLIAGNAQPLAENIEDMQIAWGIDTDGNNAITDGSTGPNEWQFAVGNAGPLLGPTRALRVTLIGRSPQALLNGPATFVRPAAEDHPVATTPDNFRRRTLTSTIEIRNTTASP